MDMKKIVVAFVALFALFELYADTYTDPDTGCTWTYLISYGSAELVPHDSEKWERVLVEVEPYYGEKWVEGIRLSDIG